MTGGERAEREERGERGRGERAMGLERAEGEGRGQRERRGGFERRGYDDAMIGGSRAGLPAASVGTNVEDDDPLDSCRQPQLLICNVPTPILYSLS